MRIRALVVFSVFALLFAVPFQAADHREAPLIREDLPADINDVFAWRSPENPSKLLLAMTVNPMSAPSENITYNFSEDVRYGFRIDRSGDAVSDFDILARFATNADGSQTFEVQYADTSVSGPVTAPTEDVNPNSAIVVDGPLDVRVFAGQRDDPFFFDVAGFNRFLSGTGTFGGNDGFAGLNVTALVVEIPLDLIHTFSMGDDEDEDDDEGNEFAANVDDGGPLQIWATTERRRVTMRRASAGKLQREFGPWEQVDRMGNPAVSTALIPLASKDLFNIGQPADDAEDFAAMIVASLQSLDTDATNIGILASVAVPDTLKFDPSMPNGFPNGRMPSDDVIDTLLFFIFNQTPVGDGVNVNDVMFLPTFPFLAPPQQPD